MAGTFFERLLNGLKFDYVMPVDASGDIISSPRTKTWAQLSATGSTDWFETDGKTLHTIQYIVGTINTNVVVKAEGSIDGVNAFNLSATDATITKTANGTYAISVGREVAISHIRFTWATEAGGSNATIDASYYGV